MASVHSCPKDRYACFEYVAGSLELCEKVYIVRMSEWQPFVVIVLTVRVSIGNVEPEDASTHKSANTHAGNVFVTRDIDL